MPGTPREPPLTAQPPKKECSRKYLSDIVNRIGTQPPVGAERCPREITARDHKMRARYMKSRDLG
jgi:hypothetical protein